jgi:hypothetical protein
MGEWRGLGLQQRREQMSFEVMDPYSGLAPGIRQAARQGGAGQKGPDQAGSSGVGDAVQLGRSGFRLLHRAANERQKSANVIPGCQLRHNAAENTMQIDLAEELMGQQTLSPVQHGDGTLITGRFDSEDTHPDSLPQPGFAF